MAWQQRDFRVIYGFNVSQSQRMATKDVRYLTLYVHFAGILTNCRKHALFHLVENVSPFTSRRHPYLAQGFSVLRQQKEREPALFQKNKWFSGLKVCTPYGE